MRKIAISSFIIAIIFSCASVQSPTGGPKDEENPYVISSIPEDQSINFSGKEVRIVFNEYIKSEQLFNQLIITPRMGLEFDDEVRKNELIISFDEPLPDSTTFTLNFREGIKDITEGNLWENPVLSFSTGNYIDSMQLTGTVKHALTHEPVEKYVVGIYDAEVDTANLRLAEPYYFTTTDPAGNFLLRNIKQDRYRLFAFEDANNDLINQSASESYGLYDSIIDLTTNYDSLIIYTYRNNEDTLKFKKGVPSGQDFRLTYNKGIKDYSATLLADTSEFLYTGISADAKELTIYKSQFPNYTFDQDSIGVVISAIDSVGFSTTDSLYMIFRDSKVDPATLSMTKKPESSILKNHTFSIAFNKPILQTNYDSILLRIDSIPYQQINASNIEWNKYKTAFTFTESFNLNEIDSLQSHYQQLADSLAKQAKTDSTSSNTTESDSSAVNTEKEDAKPKNGLNSNKDAKIGKGNNSKNTNTRPQNIKGLNLYFGSDAFISMHQDSLPSAAYPIQFKKPEDFAIVQGNIENTDEYPHFIIQLIDESFTVLDTIRNETPYTFRYVKPGKAKVRVIIDDNNNGKWDPGNPFTLTPPETVIYLDELLTMKANWELLDKNILFVK
jgi:hypothetical protein